MPICTYCGAQNSQPDAKYCSYCGSSIQQQSTTPPPQPFASPPPAPSRSYPTAGGMQFDLPGRYERALVRVERLSYAVLVLSLAVLALLFV
ncbi:MAG: zinc-ribbon domain-containing protein [Thaumarchaeota archaeon]|nr:zinc-ribbon domain-containing protein [Nitrososphaerota archaeon]